MTARKNKPHRLWIAQQPCLVSNWCCSGDVVAAHVRKGTDGGMGLKPSDKWTVPLCWYHHGLQHEIGEKTFGLMREISLKAEAARLWAESPHRDD